MLLGIDHDRRTAWPLVAIRNKLETLQKEWECAKEKLTTEKINKLLLVRQ